MKKINIIPAGKYEGYLWKSDQNIGEVVCGEHSEIVLVDGENPFIIEGFLFSEDKTSISIKYVDGKYYAFATKVSEEELADCADIREYVPNRMKCGALRFLQRWSVKNDALCEDMSVLVPGEIVFIGFKH